MSARLAAFAIIVARSAQKFHGAFVRIRIDAHAIDATPSCDPRRRQI